LTVFTVSGNIHPNSCRLVSWLRWMIFNSSKTSPAAVWVNTTRYCKYSQRVPDDGRKHCPKHV